VTDVLDRLHTREPWRYVLAVIVATRAASSIHPGLKALERGALHAAVRPILLSADAVIDDDDAQLVREVGHDGGFGGHLVVAERDAERLAVLACAHYHAHELAESAAGR
jgi:hypothetical protein